MDSGQTIYENSDLQSTVTIPGSQTAISGNNPGSQIMTSVTVAPKWRGHG